MGIFVNILNFLIDLVVVVIVFILELLPQSPFKNMTYDFGSVGGLLAFILPIGDIIRDYVSLLGAILLWYGLRYLLRLIRMVD